MSCCFRPLYLLNMTLDEVLLLCVPVVTGVLALLGSWFGSWLGRINEYRQWLRNQKQAAYSEFLGVWDALYLKTGRRDQAWAIVQAARGVGPDAGKRYEFRESAKATANEVIETIRVDLSLEKMFSAKAQR